MSEPKFTPGPWKVSGAEGCRMIAINRECPQTVVADVWGKGERHEANAALIAAAPEMYYMLEDLLANCVINGVYREQAEMILKKARG